MQRRPQVFMFPLQSLQPHDLLLPQELRFRLLCQRQVVRGMRLTSSFLLSIHGQAFEAIISYRLQHHETRLHSLLLCLLQQALIDKRSDAIQGLGCFTIIVKRSAYSIDCFQGTATDEDRESPEEALLRCI